MREDGTARAVLWLLSAVALFQLLHYYPRMPETMAVHFGPSGQPDGWSEKLPFFLIFGATEAFVVAFGLMLPALISRVPASIVNIPNRHYWFAPERRDETTSFLSKHILWIESATLVFLMAVAQIVFVVNSGDGGGRLTGDFWIVIVAFVGVVLWLSARIVMRFRSVPPGNMSPRRRSG
jgi:uncharacterized membrane protein